jgi:hypothetical protein
MWAGGVGAGLLRWRLGGCGELEPCEIGRRWWTGKLKSEDEDLVGEGHQRDGQVVDGEMDRWRDAPDSRERGKAIIRGVQGLAQVSFRIASVGGMRGYYWRLVVGQFLTHPHN